jgi:L-threonylcarbamoyladenylate synthase
MFFNNAKKLTLLSTSKLPIFASKYSKMGKLDPKELKIIIDNLNNGGTMLYPSDTLWALGCDAENDMAADKTGLLKGESGPMVVLVSSLSMLLRYVPQLPPKAGDLIEYYEKPLTILYKNCRYISDRLKAADGSVAIRVVKDPFCVSMINSFGRAIVATMASKNRNNLPCTYLDVPAEIRKAVDFTATFNRDFRGNSASVIVGINPKNELIFVRKD